MRMENRASYQNSHKLIHTIVLTTKGGRGCFIPSPAARCKERIYTAFDTSCLCKLQFLPLKIDFGVGVKIL
jgi:hypothetical protein